MAKKTKKTKDEKKPKAREEEDDQEELPEVSKDDGEEAVSFLISPENITEEYIRLPAHIALAAEKLAGAQAKAAWSKHLRDKCNAHLYLTKVQEYEDLGEKKPSDTKIKSEILDSAEYKSAVSAYISAEADKNRALGILEALRAKREMLVSLGAHVRLEMQATQGGGGTDDADDEGVDEDEEDR